MFKWNLWWPYSSEHSIPDNLFRANRIADVYRVIWAHSMDQLDIKLNTTCRKFVYNWQLHQINTTEGENNLSKHFIFSLGRRSQQSFENGEKKNNSGGNKLYNNNLRTNDTTEDTFQTFNIEYFIFIRSFPGNYSYLLGISFSNSTYAHE